MKRIPCATYRLQFNRDFTFQQAAGILDYLDELGISDLYASPLFEAGPQSSHGYDTCSFGSVNPHLGGEEDFKRLFDNLKKRGMGLLLDVVPNHMSATLSNPWWLDVLENGSESAHAGFFDIDWHSSHPGLRNKVLLPVLEDRYEKVLESGKLRLMHQGGKFFVAYYDRNFPVDTRTLPPDAAGNPSATLRRFNGTNGKRGQFDKLDELIQQQHYQLAYWKAASTEINYRRFFDVTEMAAMKMELPEVFRETHRLIFTWLDSGTVTGLRIDHPDGLWDPEEYLQRIQRRASRTPYVVVEKILSGDESLPDDWPVEGTTGYDFVNRSNGLFINGSNVSVFDEMYREFIGCDEDFREIVYSSRMMVLEQSFAGELNSLSCRLAGIASRTRSGREFAFSELLGATAGIIASFPVYRTYITEKSSEASAPDRAAIQKAVNEAQKRAAPRRGAPVFEFLERVLSLQIANELDEAETGSLREFVMKFQQLTAPSMAKGLEDTAFYRFNRFVSLNEVGGDPGRFGTTPGEFHQANSAAARQWPHTLLASSTHDTKRGEDVRARLNVLSEMPFEWRDAVAHWSRLNARNKTVVESAPAPDANDEYLLYQTLVGAYPPDADTPEGLKEFRARVAAFMLKAAKEAKVNTTWTEPDDAYENALRQFVDRVLADQGNEAFFEDLVRFARRLAFFGRINSLAQTLLKITSPGVPDFYQGSELWNLSLVDPDNRRPVDYSLRRELLAGLKQKFAQTNIAEPVSELLRDDRVGTVKLFLIWQALHFRKEHRELFDCGDYVPLPAVGEQQEHLCAFARIYNSRTVVIIVPRLVFGLTGGAESQPVGAEVWRNTAVQLPQGSAALWRNVLTRETVAAGKQDGSAMLQTSHALKSFPVAMLADN